MYGYKCTKKFIYTLCVVYAVYGYKSPKKSLNRNYKLASHGLCSFILVFASLVGERQGRVLCVSQRSGRWLGFNPISFEYGIRGVFRLHPLTLGLMCSHHHNPDHICIDKAITYDVINNETLLQRFMH